MRPYQNQTPKYVAPTLQWVVSCEETIMRDWEDDELCYGVCVRGDTWPRCHLKLRMRQEISSQLLRRVWRTLYSTWVLVAAKKNNEFKENCLVCKEEWEGTLPELDSRRENWDILSVKKLIKTHFQMNLKLSITVTAIIKISEWITRFQSKNSVEGVGLLEWFQLDKNLEGKES